MGRNITDFGVISVSGKTNEVQLDVIDVDGAAPLHSPKLTGIPTAPTAPLGTSTDQIATTAFVSQIALEAGATSITNAPPVPETVAASSQLGVSSSAARSDHVHAMPGLATPALDGFMSAADKQRLDGAAPLASPNFTGTASFEYIENKATFQAYGEDGGGLSFELPTYGTTLTGDIIIDTSKDVVRIYESGGDQRGVSFDLDEYSPYASTRFSKSNHEHIDATINTHGFMSVVDKTKLNGIAEGAAALTTNAPSALASTASVGTGTTAARSDHVHQLPTPAAIGAAPAAHSHADYSPTTHTHATYAPLASPALTGTPTAPTPTAGTSTTQIATTKFVVDAISSAPSTSLTDAVPLALASIARTGTGTTAARADHVHPLPTPVALGVAAAVHDHTVASQSTPGFMSAADKLKLDSVATDGRAYPKRSDGTSVNFNWIGKTGQPQWVWGADNGQDEANYYVYNPANFSVNYATNAEFAKYLRPPANDGIVWPSDAFGGGGDTASITLESAGGEDTRMVFRLTNDAGDKFQFWNASSGTDGPGLQYWNDGMTLNGNVLLNAANYNNYSPAKDGTGAWGTWNINIHGSSHRAKGLTRRDGNDFYMEHYWTGVRWRLGGYNSDGALHAEAEVGKADYADYATGADYTTQLRTTSDPNYHLRANWNGEHWVINGWHNGGGYHAEARVWRASYADNAGAVDWGGVSNRPGLATTGADGFMSAADKQTINSLSNTDADPIYVTVYSTTTVTVPQPKAGWKKIKMKVRVQGAGGGGGGGYADGRPNRNPASAGGGGGAGQLQEYVFDVSAGMGVAAYVGGAGGGGAPSANSAANAAAGGKGGDSYINIYGNNYGASGGDGGGGGTLALADAQLGGAGGWLSGKPGTGGSFISCTGGKGGSSEFYVGGNGGASNASGTRGYSGSGGGGGGATGTSADVGYAAYGAQGGEGLIQFEFYDPDAIVSYKTVSRVEANIRALELSTKNNTITSVGQRTSGSGTYSYQLLELADSNTINLVTVAYDCACDCSGRC